MHRLLVIFTCAALAGASVPASADFVLKSTHAASGPTVATTAGGKPDVVSDEPHVDPGDRAPITRPADPARPGSVSGFGKDVPLSFACKQILPPGRKVSYGAGVDPAMLVSWQGGHPWPVVLARAITPRGMRLIGGGSGALRIERQAHSQVDAAR